MFAGHQMQYQVGRVNNTNSLNTKASRCSYERSAGARVGRCCNWLYKHCYSITANYLLPNVDSSQCQTMIKCVNRCNHSNLKQCCFVKKTSSCFFWRVHFSTNEWRGGQLTSLFLKSLTSARGTGSGTMFTVFQLWARLYYFAPPWRAACSCVNAQLMANDLCIKWSWDFNGHLSPAVRGRVDGIESFGELLQLLSVCQMGIFLFPSTNARI